jgi:hypothetical protein
MLMPAVASPIIFPALCVGMWKSVTRASNPCRIDLLIATIPLLILGGHSILYATGRMASSGEMRYMLVVAPFWGLLAAKGWAWIFDAMQWRRPLRWAALAAIVPAIVNQHFQVGPLVVGYRVVPIHLQHDMVVAHRFAQLYKIWPLRDEYPKVLAAHPGVYYFLDISPTQKLQTREWSQKTVADVPHGTILIWDPIFGVYNSDAKRSVPEESIDSAGWVLDDVMTDTINDEQTEDADRWSVWLSPQSQSGVPTASQ